VYVNFTIHKTKLSSGRSPAWDGPSEEII
jgi:hypothetical protein